MMQLQSSAGRDQANEVAILMSSDHHISTPIIA
jgi:hypothetical protein